MSDSLSFISHSLSTPRCAVAKLEETFLQNICTADILTTSENEELLQMHFLSFVLANGTPPLQADSDTW